MAGPTIRSYDDASGSASAACYCRVTTFVVDGMKARVIVCLTCEEHAGQMVVEMKPREMVGREVSAHVHQ